MSYLFIDRYCQITAKLPELGIVVITGWVTYADAGSILIVDEDYNETLINREHIIGSIVVLEEQKPLPEIKIERVECEVERKIKMAY